jgi:hypothetical protein
MGAVPAQAAIVSRAHASVLPSFPKRGPLTLLVMAATVLLALAYTLANELIGGGFSESRMSQNEPRRRPARRDETYPDEDDYPPAAAPPARRAV